MTTYFKLRDAAERYGKHPRTLTRWIKSGKLQAIRPGHEYLISEEELERLDAASIVEPEAA